MSHIPANVEFHNFIISSSSFNRQWLLWIRKRVEMNHHTASHTSTLSMNSMLAYGGKCYHVLEFKLLIPAWHFLASFTAHHGLKRFGIEFQPVFPHFLMWSLKLDSHCTDSHRPVKSRYCRGIHRQARYIHIVAMLSASRIMNWELSTLHHNSDLSRSVHQQLPV